MRGLAISATCLLLFAGLTVARAQDRPAPAATRCELAAFPAPAPPPPHVETSASKWGQLRDLALKWLDRSEAPAAALERLGGTRLVLRADPQIFRTRILNGLRNDVHCLMREARIRYSAIIVRDDRVELWLSGPARLPDAASVLSTGTSGAVDVVGLSDVALELAPTEKGLASRLGGMLDQSIDVIAGRAKSLGIAGAGARRDGTDRILVLLPGVTDASRLVGTLASRGRLEFRLIDMSMRAEDALASAAPADSEVLRGVKDKAPYLVSRSVALGGEHIVEATPAFSPSNEPVVRFRFNAVGARIFAQLTQENVGRPFAILLDDEVISAPVIRDPILGGSGQIAGRFTVEEATTLATLLRSGALPLKLEVIEQQAVKPAQKN
jgi:preprotein translocase subunit SecD